MKIENPIRSKRLFLKTLRKRDAGCGYQEWVKDPLVNQFLELRHSIPNTEHLESYIMKMNDSDDHVFLGIFLHSWKHIGNIKLGPVDWENKRGTIGLMIGDQGEWGKGYAREAINAMTQFAFNELSLVAIDAGCYTDNIASYKAFLKAGYKEKSRTKRCWKDKSGYVDIVVLENTCID